MSALKCETCRYFGSKLVHIGEAQRQIIFCTNDKCATDQVREMFPDRHGMPLDLARNTCDRESDGIFVHFEPKTPASGSAWRECPDCTHSIAPGEEHTCQTPKDWRRQLNEQLREPKARKAAA